MKSPQIGVPPKRKVDEIAEKASEAAGRIVMEANAEGQAIEASAAAYIERMRAEYGRKLYEEIERMRKASEIKTDMAEAAELEKVHTESLSLLKEKFISMVKNSDDDRKREWASMLIEGAVSDLGVGILHVRKEDTSAALSIPGFKVVADLHASGGLIAESGDGTVLLDYTLESLAESYWESVTCNIKELLFG